MKKDNFELKDKVKFFKNKWRKDNLMIIIISFIIWVLLGLGLYNYDPKLDLALIIAVCFLVAIGFYLVFYNKMMAYVENNAYKQVKETKKKVSKKKTSK